MAVPGVADPVDEACARGDQAALSATMDRRGFTLIEILVVIVVIPVLASLVRLEPDGGRLHTADGRSNSVSVIDTKTRKVIAAVPVGERPNDLL